MINGRLLTAGAILALTLLIVALIRTDFSWSGDNLVYPVREKPLGPTIPTGTRVATTPIPSRTGLEGQPALSAPDFSELATDARSPLADQLGEPSTKPEDEPRIVLNVLNAYRRSFGAYPAGENNRQFVNALLGANKQKLAFIPHEHPRLNVRGEITDAWGTPFFFHLNSRTSIEVRSAGADRLLFTGDDLVAGRPPAPPARPIPSDEPPSTR